MRFHHIASSSLSIASRLLATTALLAITACGGNQTVLTQPQADTESPASQSTEPVTATSSAPAQQSSSDALSAQTPSPEGTAVAQASRSQAASYNIQKLSAATLAIIEQELGASESIFSDHSFSLDLPELGGNVAFVASRADTENSSTGEWMMRFRLPNGEYRTLVPSGQHPESAWNFFRMNAVSFEDVNGDGLGPDIIAIAEYATGIGPQSGKPFPVERVQLRNANGFFTADAALEEQLSSQGISTISEARQVLNLS